MYSDLISDPDVGKAFKYHAKYPGVMQGSQEGKRAKLCGPRAHFGANISLKIVLLFITLVMICESKTQTKKKILPWIECAQVRARGYSRTINTGLEQNTPF